MSITEVRPVFGRACPVLSCLVLHLHRTHAVLVLHWALDKLSWHYTIGLRPRDSIAVLFLRAATESKQTVAVRCPWPQHSRPPDDNQDTVTNIKPPTNSYPTTNNKQTNQPRQNAIRTPSIILILIIIIIINLLPPPPPPPKQQQHPPHPNPPLPTPLDNNNSTINKINTMSNLPPHRHHHRHRHNQPATRPRRRRPEPFCRGLDERPGVGCAAGWVSWFV